MPFLTGITLNLISFRTIIPELEIYHFYLFIAHRFITRHSLSSER